MNMFETLDSEIVFESTSWVIRQLFTFSAAEKYTRHSGWCTRYEKDFNSYIEEGKLYIFRKRGKARASYQLFIRDSGTTEFKHKGNEYADIWDFQANETELTHWISERVKSREEQAVSVSFIVPASYQFWIRDSEHGWTIDSGDYRPNQSPARFIGELDSTDEVENVNHGDTALISGQLYRYKGSMISPFSEWVLVEDKTPPEKKPNKTTNSGRLHNGRLVNSLRKMRGQRW